MLGEPVMETVRSLLTLGNMKVGESIHLWSTPAVDTCPGATETCKAVCYANGRGHYRFDAVKERLRWNLEQSRLDSFVPRMVKDIRRKGALVIRVHASGDFGDEVYARKWLTIMRQCPRPRFYFYTRSWRIPSIAPALEEMAALKCCRAWYSTDRDTGLPDRIPPGVRLAFLQVSEDDTVENSDLLFRVRRLRKDKKRIGLPTLCPSETQRGRDRDVNCGNCTRCFS